MSTTAGVALMNGVVIGLVKDIDDPAGEGRIRVQFPWLSAEEMSGWAPIARTMAGKSRGFWYMPEIDDEVLVAFEFGDFDHPFVLGFLHNGVDVPPSDGIDASVRRQRTVSGHMFEFDDRSGKERITLVTQGKQKLEMKDSGGDLVLTTANGQQLAMSDTTSDIKLSTTSGTSVTISDQPSSIKLSTVAGVTVTITDTGGVSVSAPTGALDITCLTATVNATSSCEVNSASVTCTGASVAVNSAIATFSGVVQCTTLIATSVVSSSYTPGAGNIW